MRHVDTLSLNHPIFRPQGGAVQTANADGGHSALTLPNLALAGA